MSHGLCSDYCKTRQFLYAVLVAGNACHCSNKRPAEENKVEDILCDAPCVGYPFEACGSKRMEIGTLVAKARTVTGIESGSDGQSPSHSQSSIGAYVNVLLIDKSLSAIPLTFAPSSTTTFSTPSPTTSSILRKKSDNPLITHDNDESSTVSPETTNDDVGKNDIGVHENVESGVHGDENEQDTAGNEDEDSNKSVEKDQDDEKEDDEEDEDGSRDEDGSGDEDRSDDEDEDEDGNDRNMAPGGSGMALAGQRPSFSGLSIASTTVGVVCLLGICGFFVYLCRKRKRERIQTAWVASVSNSGGQNRPRATRPYGYRNSGASNQRYNDMESVSDGRSEMTMDRRRSATMGPVMMEGSFSNATRISAMPPALVRNMHGMVEYNHHPGTITYHHQIPDRMPSNNDQLLQANQYEAFYNQDECEDHAEIAIPDIYSSAGAYRNQYKYHPHSLRTVKVPDHRDHGNPLRDAVASPLSRHPVYPTNHRHSLDSTVHLYTLAASNMSCGARSRQQPGMSEYRRPHSVALDSTGGNLAISERYNAPHILEEDEGEERAFRKSFKRNEKEKSNGNVLTGSLRQQLKRLSVPYVQAIRQRQRTCASASCMETGHGGNGNERNHSIPVSELVTTLGQRRSRVLSRGNVESNKGGEFNEISRSSSGNSEDEKAKAFKTDDGVNVSGEQSRRMRGHSSRRHQWEHSGSLDSFQGLDGSSPQRLRVMNPDDG